MEDQPERYSQLIEGFKELNDRYNRIMQFLEQWKVFCWEKGCMEAVECLYSIQKDTEAIGEFIDVFKALCDKICRHLANQEVQFLEANSDNDSGHITLSEDETVSAEPKINQEED